MDRYNDCTYLLRTQQRCTVLKFLAQFVSKLLQLCYLSIQKMDISLSLSLSCVGRCQRPSNNSRYKWEKEFGRKTSFTCWLKQKCLTSKRSRQSFFFLNCANQDGLFFFSLQVSFCRKSMTKRSIH